MRKKAIEVWVESVREHFGRPRARIGTEEVRKLFEARKYGAMLSFVRKTMYLEHVPMEFGKVVSPSGRQAPAWADIWTTVSGEIVQIRIFFRKEFLIREPLGIVLFAMAHELSHVLLNKEKHRLREVEEVVDITAMFMGYGDLFLKESLVAERPIEIITKEGEEISRQQRVGYLTLEEKQYVMDLLKK
jgi:hypothetical protein